MNYSCIYFNHLDEPIQGFCLNLDCKSKQDQFCLKCYEEQQIHSDHKSFCKTFKEIEEIINDLIIKLTDQQKKLQQAYDLVKNICDKNLKELETNKVQLKNINSLLIEQNYFDFKQNISILKQLYQSEIITNSSLSFANDLYQNKLLIKALEDINYEFQKQETNSLIQIEKNQNNEESQINEANQIKYFETGLLLIKQREWKEALNVFTTCLKINMKDPRYIFYYCWILNEINKCQESQKFLEEAININPNLYLDINNWVTEKLKEQNQNLIFLITKGCALIGMGETEKSLSFFDAALMIDEKHIISYIQKGQLLQKQKKIEQAFVNFEKAINHNFNKSQTHYYKGIILFEQKRYEEALQSFKFSIQFDPNYSEGYFLIGNILRIMKKSEEAIQYYNHAIEFDSQFKYYVGKGLSLLDIQKYQEALICIEQVLSIDSNYLQAIIIKGSTLHSLKKYNEALNCFDEVLKQSPNSVVAYKQKGRTLQKLKLKKEALQCFEAALKIDQQDITIYFNKSNVLRDMNLNNEALQCIDQVILLEPENAESFMIKGIILEEMKKYKEAIQCFQMAIALRHVDSDKIKGWISSISTKSGIQNIFSFGKK